MRKPLETPIEIVERRLRDVEPTATGCLLWPGATYGDGYGYITLNRNRTTKNMAVSRVVLAAALGRDLIPGMNALHRCDVAACANRDHLYEGTQGRNMLDAYERGRRPIGERSHLARLSDADVAEIRRSAESSAEAAARYGVSRQYIWALRTGRERRYEKEGST